MTAAAAAPQWIVPLLWIAPFVTVLAMLAHNILDERREQARFEDHEDDADGEPGRAWHTPASASAAAPEQRVERAAALRIAVSNAPQTGTLAAMSPPRDERDVTDNCADARTADCGLRTNDCVQP